MSFVLKTPTGRAVAWLAPQPSVCIHTGSQTQQSCFVPAASSLVPVRLHKDKEPLQSSRFPTARGTLCCVSWTRRLAGMPSWDWASQTGERRLILMLLWYVSCSHALSSCYVLGGQDLRYVLYAVRPRKAGPQGFTGN